MVEVLKLGDVDAAFTEGGAWGLSTSIDLHGCDPQLIRDPEMIKRYIDELCDLIDMKPFGEMEIVYFGEKNDNGGYSAVQFIETSLISAHFVDRTNNGYIDVFSCKPYDPELVAKFSKEFFRADDVRVHTLIRG
ncbi:MAG TPA: S-adenosylmethionine decarboxylase [Candidatus Syntrophoarchaeum butanivorans]|uniref:S-adenosylmethionine decarboxylase n=1 Tax=Candidatus Syntropharchaeum butanivorans TaxID=1839936 RepID=A0A7C0X2A5_9EURY|nr:S-adenosylmethionine decarboxylase [Candidatus Syntrophoarchaeum butanivorans]